MKYRFTLYDDGVFLQSKVFTSYDTGELWAHNSELTWDYCEVAVVIEPLCARK